MCTGTELILPIIMGAATAASGMAQSAQQSAQESAQQQYQAKQANYQAAQAAENAKAMRQQADNERRKGEMEQESINRERDRMRRDYETQAGSNRSLLAAAGVDMTSGSAADNLIGNANTFASDLQINRHNHAIAGYDAGERARQAEYQGVQYDNQAAVSRGNASWLNRTSGNLGLSLLTSGLSGVNSGLSVYRKF